MEYILLPFAFEDNADMEMWVISVNLSKGIFPVKFLIPSVHRTLSVPKSTLTGVLAKDACPEGS